MYIFVLGIFSLLCINGWVARVVKYWQFVGYGKLSFEFFVCVETLQLCGMLYVFSSSCSYNIDCFDVK